MESNSGPLDGMVCDVETGVCGPADASEGTPEAPKLMQLRPPVKKVDLYYATDPSAPTAGRSSPSCAGFVAEQSGDSAVNSGTVLGETYWESAGSFAGEPALVAELRR